MKLRITPEAAYKFFERIENGDTSEKKDKTSERKSEGDGDKKAELEKTLDKIDADYAANGNRTYGGISVPDLKEKEYNAPTDDEIVAAAEKELGASADVKRNALKSGAQEKTNDLNAEIESVKKAGEERRKSLGEKYAVAKENAENQAIKRGIARSSIVAEQLKDLDKANIAEDAEIEKSVAGEISAINEKIQNLTDELSAAIADLDMQTAVKVNERINQLKTERQKRTDEVLEYNNKIAEKRASVAEKLAKNGQVADEKESDEYAKMRGDKLDALYAYYYSLGKSAPDRLKADRDFVEKHVGGDGYEYLLKTVNR